MDKKDPSENAAKAAESKPSPKPPVVLANSEGTSADKAPLEKPQTNAANAPPSQSWYRRMWAWFRSSERGTHAERIIALFTFVIALVGIGQYVIFDKQLDIFK